MVVAVTEHASSTTLFDAHDLVVEYRVRGRVKRALDHVSLSVAPSESVGLIGESGSGKTTLARCMLGLIKPSSGRVLFRDKNIYEWRAHTRHRTLGQEAAMVFQDPRSSLNPRLSVEAVIRDPLTVQKIGTPTQQRDKVAELLSCVGLPSALAARPVRALSGGQLQRVALARALATEPAIIIADEPTSALDVSVQAQILNLLNEIRRTRQLALLVVSHDIRVIRFLTDRTAVMNNGQIVEVGSTENICETPTHKYTKTLLASAPRLRQAGRVSRSV